MDHDRKNADARTGRTPIDVLLVDDDKDLCESLVASLRPRGFRLTWKASAEAALEAIEQGDWDVLLTDVNMAEMSGLGLCERAVANRPDQRWKPALPATHTLQSWSIMEVSI